jgi:hypothetical protein
MLYCNAGKIAVYKICDVQDGENVDCDLLHCVTEMFLTV